MGNSNLFDEEVGLLRTGTIVDYDSARGVLKVRLNNAPSIKGKAAPVDVPAPHTMFYNNGLFIGTLPAPKTPVVIGQGSGGRHYFVSFLAENLPVVPDLTLGQLLIQSTENSKITLDIKNNIGIGSDNFKLHANTTLNLYSNNFYNQYRFTQAARNINGIIKRDLKPNSNFDQDSKLENDSYDPYYYTIGLDPSVSPNPIITGSNKNPPLVEHRELVYEFQPISEVDNDLLESELYATSKSSSSNFKLPNRRKSRADTLSLTLASPNYLMETTKGTVVDIFGNILDINRAPIAVGKGQNTLRADKSSNKTKSFLSIKALERKSLAFHFEINARKDLSGSDGKIILPDINSNLDYARNRSRFFVDIDKEGQMKMNVPASSETGNISLLTRYENYSTFGPEDNNNPNKLIFRDDNLDIFQDSFAAPKFDLVTGLLSEERGSIRILDGDAEATPIDRITGKHIRHGTAYHDLLATCYSLQKLDYLDFQSEAFIDISSIPLLKNVVSNTLQISGPDANCGGRSSSIHLDGSMELNIGANTSDRQSLLLDTAGGIVANIGRDKNSNSAVVSMDGDCIVQIGGVGVSSDSRFIKMNNAFRGGTLDIRVLTSGLRSTMIRVSPNGDVQILSPGNIQLHAAQALAISSDANMSLTAENLYLNDRLVNKIGGSI